MAAALADPVFRFDKSEHRYFLDGVEIPHITTMLSDCGYIDETYFNEEGRDRGTMVHALTADYDLGALPNPAALECVWKGFVLGHVAAMRAVKPIWRHVETALVSPTYRFGGRPDRVGKVWGAWAVVDIKTGARHAATPIQTALQALLVAPELHLPATAIVRYELDLKESGRWQLYEHVNRRDFDKAYEVISACCPKA